MSKKALMSVVDAAGYAMAAPEDDVPSVNDTIPEVALRNGHQTAAHKSPAAQHSMLKEPGQWVREALNGWWGGKAPA